MSPMVSFLVGYVKKKGQISGGSFSDSIFDPSVIGARLAPLKVDFGPIASFFPLFFSFINLIDMKSINEIQGGFFDWTPQNLALFQA